MLIRKCIPAFKNYYKYIMLIKEVITEAKSKYDPVTVADLDVHKHAIEVAKKIIKYIKTNCKPWLSKTQNGKLIAYRGSRTLAGSGKAFVKATRTDRKPKDTGLNRHETFNNLIAVAGGTANRSNSLFCTSSPNQAASYGTVYVMFPVGNFKYTWSPKYRDWTNDLEEDEIEEYFLKRTVANSLYDMPRRTDRKKVLQNPKSYNLDRVKKAIITNTGLDKALRMTTEIMVQCSGAVYVQYAFFEHYIRPLMLGKKISDNAINNIGVTGDDDDYNDYYESAESEGEILDEDNLNEGVNDPHIFKAVFTIGGPGSGKTTIANKLLGHSGLRPVNVDQFYEMMQAKDPVAGGYQQELYGHAKIKLEKRQHLLIDGRLGLVIDGTGKNLRRIQGLRDYLTGLGYDCMALFIDTDLETALHRNQSRARRVKPELVKQMHAAVRQNLKDINTVFNGNVISVDNSYVPDIETASKKIDKFLDASPSSPKAKEWVDSKKKPVKEDISQKKTFKDEIGEFERVSKQFNIPLNVLKQSYDAAKLAPLDNKTWSRLDNTESYDITNWSEVEQLAKKYGRDLQSIKRGLDRVPPPIILTDKTHSKFHLISGNTRLMAMRAAKMQPHVIFVKVDKF